MKCDQHKLDMNLTASTKGSTKKYYFYRCDKNCLTVRKRKFTIPKDAGTQKIL